MLDLSVKHGMKTWNVWSRCYGAVLLINAATAPTAAIAPGPHDIVVFKQKPSGFFGTNMAAWEAAKLSGPPTPQGLWTAYAPTPWPHSTQRGLFVSTCADGYAPARIQAAPSFPHAG
jgi:hypothetical protein